MGGSAVGGGGGVDGSAVGGGGVGAGGGGAHAGPVRVIDFGPSPVLSLTVHDGVLFAGTYSGHVLRHDGTAVTSSAPLGAPVPSLTVHDGTLVAGTYNGEFLLITPDTLGVVERIGAHGGSVKSLAAVPGGFLSAATDRSVEAGGAYARSRLWEHGNLVNAVAVLGDQVAASASRDHTVKAGRITRLPGGTWRAERVQTLLGPDESVKCVALMGSAERPVVLAGSYDFGLYAWQVDWQEAAATLASGRVVAEFAQGLSCMHRLQDGTVAVAGWDGRILLVGVDSAGLPVIERSLHLGDLLTTPTPVPAAAARCPRRRAARRRCTAGPPDLPRRRPRRGSQRFFLPRSAGAFVSTPRLEAGPSTKDSTDEHPRHTARCRPGPRPGPHHPGACARPPGGTGHLPPAARRRRAHRLCHPPRTAERAPGAAAQRVPDR